MLNDTKVIPAQLAGRRAQTGGRWQGLFIEATPDGHWRILCKTRGRLNPGEAITLVDREGRPGAKLWLIERLDEGQWLAHAESRRVDARRFWSDWAACRCRRTSAAATWSMPTSPTIRPSTPSDPGAIAAPTAGLAFHEASCSKRSRRAAWRYSRVTLHVGLGTFRPIESETLDEHRMHSEWGEITAADGRRAQSQRAPQAGA